MKMYRVVVSFDVEANDEEHAAREAMNVVTDDSHVIESIAEKTEIASEFQRIVKSLKPAPT